MIVQLYTDAGVKAGVGTWAFVVVIAGAEPVEASGRFRAGVGCSTRAELQAIGNAIHRMKRAGHISAGDEVVVRSDNKRAIERINGREFERPERQAKLIEVGGQVERIAREAGIILRGVWVKGHQPATSTDAHAVHNRRCDELCRIARTKPAAQAPTKARKAIIIARKLEGRA